MADHVAILIVGYRCPGEIRRCLESLAQSTHSDFVVHICENGGRSAYETLLDELACSPALTQSKPGVARSRVVVETRVASICSGGQSIFVHCAHSNLGYAGGVNASLDALQAGESWSGVWILNPDTEVHPQALEGLVAYAENENYGIVGSRLVLAETGQIQLYGGRWRQWLARGFNIGMGAPADAKPDVAKIEQEMDYVSGASMFVTRRYIEAVGRMDEKYFLYNEEVDWCFKRGSFRLGYAHDSIVYHSHGATIGSSTDMRQRSPTSVYLDERNKLLFSRRFYPAQYPIIVLATLLLTSQYLVGGAASNFRYALAGWFAGLIGQDGPPSSLQSRMTVASQECRGAEVS